MMPPTVPVRDAPRTATERGLKIALRLSMRAGERSVMRGTLTGSPQITRASTMAKLSS